MAQTPETGFLVIADLTGYTAYLAQSELEHAPTIAGDLLETIVGRLEPPFRLAKFEGDAAFLSVEDGRADGSLLLDAVEASYLAFRRRLRSIDQATTCDCNSCALAPKLDLKLFVHHGSYVRTTIAGRDELAGSDVIVVHRLLKGATAEAARANGFALFTAAAIDALGLDAAALGLAEATEAIEHLGTVTTFTLDLEARWAVERQARRLDVGDGDRVVDLEAIVPAEPADVWAHLTSPELRTLWEGPLEIVESSPSGRRGVGTQAQCVTGRLATLEEIVDWQPYDHVGWRIAVPALGPVGATADLEPVAGGTRLTVRWAYQGEGRGRSARGGARPCRARGGLRAPHPAAGSRVAGSRQEGGNGMTRYEAQAEIARSADEVWTYAADILRHTEWMSVADAHLLAGDGTQVGARGRERLLLGPFKWDVEFEVAEAEPGRRLLWRSRDARFDMQVGLELEPSGPTSVRARYYGAAQMHGRWRLLSPLVAMEGSAGMKRELAQLKARVEEAPAAVAAAS